MNKLDLEDEILQLETKVLDFKGRKLFSSYSPKDEWDEHYSNIKQLKKLKDIERERVLAGVTNE